MSINDIVNINKRLFFIGPSKLKKDTPGPQKVGGHHAKPQDHCSLCPRKEARGRGPFTGPEWSEERASGPRAASRETKKGANGGRKGSVGGKGRWGRGFGRARLTRSWTYIKQVKKEGVAGPCCPIFFRWQVQWLVRDSAQENDQCLALKKQPCKRQIKCHLSNVSSYVIFLTVSFPSNMTW
jgi:hypothetical protein